MKETKTEFKEMFAEPKTAFGNVFQDVIDNNIKHFIMLVNKKAMTKTDARTTLRRIFGADIELPPELLDDDEPEHDDEQLPPNAEFIV